jgi:hypothetical protein
MRRDRTCILGLLVTLAANSCIFPAASCPRLVQHRWTKARSWLCIALRGGEPSLPSRSNPMGLRSNDLPSKVTDKDRSEQSTQSSVPGMVSALQDTCENFKHCSHLHETWTIFEANVSQLLLRFGATPCMLIRCTSNYPARMSQVGGKKLLASDLNEAHVLAILLPFPCFPTSSA